MSLYLTNIEVIIRSNKMFENEEIKNVLTVHKS